MAESYLAKLYATSVINGQRSIEQVPEKFRIEVEQLLQTKPENKK